MREKRPSPQRKCRPTRRSGNGSSFSSPFLPTLVTRRVVMDTRGNGPRRSEIFQTHRWSERANSCGSVYPIRLAFYFARHQSWFICMIVSFKLLARLTIHSSFLLAKEKRSWRKRDTLANSINSRKKIHQVPFLVGFLNVPVHQRKENRPMRSWRFSEMRNESISFLVCRGREVGGSTFDILDDRVGFARRRRESGLRWPAPFIFFYRQRNERKRNGT